MRRFTGVILLVEREYVPPHDINVGDRLVTFPEIQNFEIYIVEEKQAEDDGITLTLRQWSTDTIVKQSCAFQSSLCRATDIRFN